MSSIVRQVTGTVERVRGSGVPEVKIEHGDKEVIVGFAIKESGITQFASARKTHDFCWTAYLARPA